MSATLGPESETVMTKGMARFATISLIAVMILGGAGGAFVLKQKADEKDAALPPPRELPLKVVEAVEVTRRDVPVVIEARGFLEAFDDITLTAQVAAQVREGGKRVENGDGIQAGEAICELVATDFELLVAAAEANLDAARAQAGQADAGIEAARAQIQTAEATQDQRHSELDRVTRLYEDGQAGQIEMDLITTAARIADGAMRSANAQMLEVTSRQAAADAAVAAAKADLETAKVALSRCVIRSPITGRISATYFDEGEYVMPARPVAEVVRLDKLKLLIQLPDDQAVLIKPGQQVAVNMDAYPDQPIADAVVFQVMPKADPFTKKYGIEIHVNNPDGKLLANMYGTARILLEQRSGVLLVRREAVFERFQSKRCYVIRQGEGAFQASSEKVKVCSLPGVPREFEVIEGLVPGDWVVLSGHRELTHEMPVDVRRVSGADAVAKAADSTTLQSR